MGSSCSSCASGSPRPAAERRSCNDQHSSCFDSAMSARTTMDDDHHAQAVEEDCPSSDASFRVIDFPVYDCSGTDRVPQQHEWNNQQPNNDDARTVSDRTKSSEKLGDSAGDSPTPPRRKLSGVSSRHSISSVVSSLKPLSDTHNHAPQQSVPLPDGHRSDSSVTNSSGSSHLSVGLGERIKKATSAALSTSKQSNGSNNQNFRAAKVSTRFRVQRQEFLQYSAANSHTFLSPPPEQFPSGSIPLITLLEQQSGPSSGEDDGSSTRQPHQHQRKVQERPNSLMPPSITNEHEWDTDGLNSVDAHDVYDALLAEDQKQERLYAEAEVECRRRNALAMQRFHTTPEAFAMPRPQHQQAREVQLPPPQPFRTPEPDATTDIPLAEFYNVSYSASLTSYGKGT